MGEIDPLPSSTNYLLNPSRPEFTDDETGPNLLYLTPLHGLGDPRTLHVHNSPVETLGRDGK